jgi:hypothetical protein
MKKPYWDGKIHKQAKFGDISIKGAVKEPQTKLQRQQFARREASSLAAFLPCGSDTGLPCSVPMTDVV